MEITTEIRRQIYTEKNWDWQFGITDDQSTSSSQLSVTHTLSTSSPQCKKIESH